MAVQSSYRVTEEWSGEHFNLALDPLGRWSFPSFTRENHRTVKTTYICIYFLTYPRASGRDHSERVSERLNLNCALRVHSYTCRISKIYIYIIFHKKKYIYVYLVDINLTQTGERRFPSSRQSVGGRY